MFIASYATVGSFGLPFIPLVISSGIYAPCFLALVASSINFLFIAVFNVTNAVSGDLLPLFKPAASPAGIFVPVFFAILTELLKALFVASSTFNPEPLI